MRLLRAALLALGILGVVACAGPVAKEPDSGSSVAKTSDAGPTVDEQLATLLEWFGGEWDNHEQHWRHKTVEEREKPIEWIHHVFRPVAAPAVGENLFFVRQTFGDKPGTVYRQRLYRFEADEQRQAVRLIIYTFRDEAKYADAWKDPAILTGLTPAELEARPGCDVWWRLEGERFLGSMDKDACRFQSARLGKEIIINDDLVLTSSELWIRDVAVDSDGNRVFGDPDGEHHQNRKVSYFEGWAAIKRGGPEADADSKDWIGMRGIVMHNEGERVRVVDEDGKPVGYSIELARLTYQNSQTAILKLGVIDDATGKTIAYTWNEPDGRRLGINLGWFQAGVTIKAEGPNARW